MAIWQAWSDDDGSWAWGKLHPDGTHEVYGDGLTMGQALAAVDTGEGEAHDREMGRA